MPDNYETPVENVAPDMPVADAQGASAEEVVISAEPSTAPATGSSKNPVESSPADGAQQYANQKDIDAAFGKRIAQVRRQYETSGEYALGAMLIEERAQRDGVSRQEALKRIQQERLDERADTYAKNPKEFYKDYLQGNVTPPQRQPAFQEPAGDIEDPQVQARRIGEELASMYQAGNLPQGFDIQRSLDQDTYNNIVEFGAPAAMRIWAAEHGPEREIARRQSGPAPMRPTSSNKQSAPTDYSSISSDDYYKKKAEIRQAMLNGKRVRLS